jgi:hypothetical protein
MTEELRLTLDWQQVKDHLEYFKIDHDGKNKTGMFHNLIKHGIDTHNVNIIIAGILVNPTLTVELANGDRLPDTARQALREHPTEALELEKLASKTNSAVRTNKNLPKAPSSAKKLKSGKERS